MDPEVVLSVPLGSNQMSLQSRGPEPLPSATPLFPRDLVSQTNVER